MIPGMRGRWSGPRPRLHRITAMRRSRSSKAGVRSGTSSTLTIHLAVRALRKAKVGVFGLWWFLTMALGTIFLVSTGREWHHLIYEKGFNISTNLFGTTYYSLVGLHAFHVTVGLLAIALAMIFTLLGKVKPEHSE